MKALTESTRQEWEAFCREDYAKYKEECPPPFPEMFWSGSMFYNSYSEWWEKYSQHIQKVGTEFWKQYGYRVADWNVPSDQRITIQPIQVETA